MEKSLGVLTPINDVILVIIKAPEAKGKRRKVYTAKGIYLNTGFIIAVFPV